MSIRPIDRDQLKSDFASAMFDETEDPQLKLIEELSEAVEAVYPRGITEEDIELISDDKGKIPHLIYEIYETHRFISGVSNGGFAQYLHNYGGKGLITALNGLEQIGAQKQAEIASKAFLESIYLRINEEEVQQKVSLFMNEDYSGSARSKENTLGEELDKIMYDEQYFGIEPYPEDLLDTYMENHRQQIEKYIESFKQK